MVSQLCRPPKNRPTPKISGFDAEPLISLVKARVKASGHDWPKSYLDSLGLDSDAYLRMQRQGYVTLAVADLWATRMGVWPGSLWDTYE